MESQELVDTLLGSPVERYLRVRRIRRRTRRFARATWIFLLLLALAGELTWARSVSQSLAALRAAQGLEEENVPDPWGAFVPLLAVACVAIAALVDERRARRIELESRSFVLTSDQSPFALRALFDARRRAVVLADEQGRVLGELDASGDGLAWRARSPGWETTPPRPGPSS